MATASVGPVGGLWISNISPVSGLYLTWFSKSLYGPGYRCPGKVHLPAGFGNFQMALWISIAPPSRSFLFVL